MFIYSNIHYYSLIVHLFEQSDIDIDNYLRFKNAKSVNSGGG